MGSMRWGGFDGVQAAKDVNIRSTRLTRSESLGNWTAQPLLEGLSAKRSLEHIIRRRL